MKNSFKTITLLDDKDCPSVTILPGHVSLELFNEAFKAEGWEADPWPEEYISYEYWIYKGEGVWETSHKGVPDARPVTVAEWEGPNRIGLH